MILKKKSDTALKKILIHNMLLLRVPTKIFGANDDT